jgi:hypothetical protein
MKKIDNKSRVPTTINETCVNEMARVEVLTMVEEVEMDEPLIDTVVVVDVVVEIWAMGSSVDGGRLGLWQLQESVLIRGWHEEEQLAQHFIVETIG